MAMTSIVFIVFTSLIFGYTQGTQSGNSFKREAHSHQVSDYPGGYLAPYKMDGEAPSGLEEFESFVVSYKRPGDEMRDDARELLIPKRNGNIGVGGYLRDKSGQRYTFSRATLNEEGPVTRIFKSGVEVGVARAVPIRLLFSTKAVDGIRYAFKGKYLDEPEVSSRGRYIKLKGVLTKFVGRHRTAEGEMSYYQDVRE